MVKNKEIIFDSIASVYDDWYKTPLGRFADIVESNLIFKHLPSLQGKNLLDLGCGTGLYSIRALEKGAIVTGIDISEKMLSLAQEKVKTLSLQINFVLGDMEHLPFNNDSFDVVLSVTSLEFSKNPEMVLREILRVLKKGGKTVIGVLSASSLWAKKRKEKAKTTDSVYLYAHFFKPEELKTLLTKAGFKSVIIESSLFIPPNDSARLPKFAHLREYFGKIFTPLNGAFLVGVGEKGSTD